MKPQERSEQTATQVKVLSPENFVMARPTVFMYWKAAERAAQTVSGVFLVRGLRPWYADECRFHELGRPVCLPWEKDKAGQSERGKNGPTDMRESDRLIVEA